MGQLENFPPKAQQKIEAARGLEQFLLESFRFVMHGNVIMLKSHDACFPDTLDEFGSVLVNVSPYTCSMDESEPKGSSHLNPSAKEFLPQSKNFNLSDSSESYDHATCPSLPVPCVFDPLSSQHLNYKTACQDGLENGKADEQEAEYQYCFDVPLNAFNTEALGSDNNYINIEDDDVCPKSKTIFVQVRHCIFGTFFFFSIFIGK